MQYITKKGKAVLVTRLGGHRVLRRRGSNISPDNCLADSGEVIRVTRRPPLSKDDSWYSFLLEGHKAKVRLEGLDKLKHPVNSLGIELENFNFYSENWKNVRLRCREQTRLHTSGCRHVRITRSTCDIHATEMDERHQFAATDGDSKFPNT
jgi:hypothetical protein